jgi:teichuronic acid biosynthesis glycosyltransferase TuaC
VNILVLTEMYPRVTDPTAGAFVHHECLALRRRGFDFRVLSPLPYAPRILWNNPKWRSLGLVSRGDAWDGIPVRYPRYVRPPGAFYRGCSPFAMFPALFASFRTWFHQNPFDLIHAHGLLPCGMAALLLSKTFHLPCVCHARGSDVNTYPRESKANFLLTRYVIENCDVPLAVSKDLADKMTSMARVPRKVAVLYTTVDTHLFTAPRDRDRLRHDLGIPSGTFVAIYVGDVSREKGVLDLMEAWKGIRQTLPACLLVVVGEGPLSGRLTRLVPGVRMCGRRPHAEVASWMQASDVLLLPSYSEGLPTVVAEAMACQLPIVASSVGGIPEAIVHEQNGFLIRPGDRRALASSIRILAERRSLAMAMGKRSRHRAEALFGSDTYVASARRVYQIALEAAAGKCRLRKTKIA